MSYQYFDTAEKIEAETWLKEHEQELAGLEVEEDRLVYTDDHHYLEYLSFKNGPLNQPHDANEVINLRREEARQLIRRLLRRNTELGLSRQQGLILVLTALGYDKKDICGILQIPESQLRWQLTRIRRKCSVGAAA